MRIAIYLDPVSPTGAPGGAAYSACLLAEHLEPHHEVDLLHHRSNFTRELLNATFGLQMNRTRVQFCEPVKALSAEGKPWPWMRYRSARGRRAQLSAEYDAFIAFVHQPPPFCHATTGILVVLFPIFRRKLAPEGRGPIKAALARAYDGFEWRRRLASYRHRVAISEFSAAWTRTRWNVDCAILYPPVNLIKAGPKQDVILSVGRFTPIKRQLELVAAFSDAAGWLPPGWSYACAGGSDRSTRGAEYFSRVEGAAGAASVHFYRDVQHVELSALYGRAKIFWHAMGYGADIDRFPERMEHFGIVTAEAMSAGCVPVVFDGGGPAELVRHGVDGFRWKTIDELHDYTRRLATDDSQRAAMARSASMRATQYSKESYLAAMTRLIDAR